MFKLIEEQGDHAEAVQDLCETTLEYCQATCSQWLLGDQKILEQVQHRAVKLMTNLRSKTYEGKLKELGLTTRQNTGFLNFEKTLKSNLELRRNQFSQRGLMIGTC